MRLAAGARAVGAGRRCVDRRAVRRRGRQQQRHCRLRDLAPWSIVSRHRFGGVAPECIHSTRGFRAHRRAGAGRRRCVGTGRDLGSRDPRPQRVEIRSPAGIDPAAGRSPVRRGRRSSLRVDVARLRPAVPREQPAAPILGGCRSGRCHRGGGTARPRPSACAVDVRRAAPDSARSHTPRGVEREPGTGWLRQVPFRALVGPSGGAGGHWPGRWRSLPSTDSRDWHSRGPPPFRRSCSSPR